MALIEGNVRREVLEQLPADAPSFFFVDIQNDQLARFEQIARASPGVKDVQQVPMMRARIVAVNGVPADQVKATPDTRWALSGDRSLTYAATPPSGTHIVAGHWWPSDYDGPPLVSFDAGLAAGWHVEIGDTIRVNVLGRDIDLKVASLRDIAWQTLSLNFAMVASPGLLAHAPHTHIATVRVAGPDQGALLRAVTDALPNVTGIAVADVLAAVAALLGQVAAALAATGSLALAAGALVLVGAVAAGQRRRTAEAVILKTLGATRAPDPRGVAGRVRLARPGRRNSGGAGRDRCKLRRAALYHARGVGVPARHPGGDPDHGSRHDAGFRLRWHCGGAPDQGGAVAAQRMKKPPRPGRTTIPHLNHPGRSPKCERETGA